jgi:two-component system NtrC family sensor kinase
VPGKAVGRAAVDLPWLCPNTDSLIALADDPAGVPGASVADPALAVFILRFAHPAPPPETFLPATGALFSAVLPETAAAFLDATTAGVVAEGSFVVGRVRGLADRAAAIASGLADATRLVPEHVAAQAARLAPLGWYAVVATDPFSAGEPLGDPQFCRRPAEIQTEVWGLDQAAVARRLAARWRVPAWLATTVGNLTLPFRVARELVSHRDLFAITQLAILEAECEGTPLGLTHGADRGELLDYLGLDELAVDRSRRTHVPAAVHSRLGLDHNPHHVPLVRNLLRLAGESRRRNGPGLVVRLEEHIDAMQRLVVDLGEQAGERLRDAKLAGLAELAAGAGHEINNPLAIISGNAQRLLRTEHDEDRSESLRAIVRQANRIAGLLRDLMQFARPPRPQPLVFPVGDLLQDVKEDVAALAAERGVRVEFAESPGSACVYGDRKQFRHALGAIVRNAVEAVVPDGWVRVSCDTPEGASPEITVEDSGPGLSPEIAEHAFDPFFCGRAAGRGRGLGLPTAWQLLRQNGGDIRYAPTPESPSRFVITARPAPGRDLLTLRSA